MSARKKGLKIPERKAGMDEINITPLIDVVLVLLIIFMVLTPITVQTMASRLPPTDKDDTPPPDQPQEQLMVEVYDDGTLALNLSPQTDETLRQELFRRLRVRAKKTVFIDADADANYARVVEVIDMARNSGAENVGFAELSDEGPPRLSPSAPAPAPPG